MIGALIAKALYLYTKKRILVVCYTNHALDQFLEDLLTAGIPGTQMVRLGSTKKSPDQIKNLGLSVQATPRNLGGNHWAMLDGKRQTAIEHASTLRTEFQSYLAKDATLADLKIQTELDLSDPEFEDAFNIPDTGDGMRRVAKKGKSVGDHYLLEGGAVVKMQEYIRKSLLNILLSGVCHLTIEEPTLIDGKPRFSIRSSKQSQQQVGS